MKNLISIIGILFWITQCPAGKSQVISGLASDSQPQTHEVAPFVTEDVVAIAAIDFTALKLQSIGDLLASLEFASAEEIEVFLSRESSKVAALRKLGIRKAYCLFRPNDVGLQTTCVVIPYSGGQPERAIEGVQNWLKSYSNFAKLESQIEPNALVLSHSKQHIHSLLSGAARKDIERISERIASLDGLPLSLSVFGNEDIRRVLRELVPEFTGDYQGLSGQLLADGVEDLTAYLTIEPDNTNLFIQCRTHSSEAAGKVGRLAGVGMRKLTELEAIKKRLPPQVVSELFALLKPKVDQNTVSISTEAITQAPEKAKQFAKSIKDYGIARLSAVGRKTRLRSIALAILNFESAHGHSPPLAITNDDGKPLLSWRVAILPFFGDEENQLYKKFKLNEPWDSEHNLPLSKQMPSHFWDTATNLKSENEARTVFQIPAGDGTILSGEDEVKFSDLSDGSSNTILAVATTPSKAVVWTKPNDWKVDFKNPLLGLFDQQQNETSIVYADGSTHRIKNDTDIQNLIRLLKRADGEIVKTP